MAGLGGAAQAAHLRPELRRAARVRGSVQQSVCATLLPSHAEAGWLLRHFLSPKLLYFYNVSQMGVWCDVVTFTAFTWLPFISLHPLAVLIYDRTIFNSSICQNML
jgi:hypothetical protein